LGPLGHAIAREMQAVVPEIRCEARFAFELPKKPTRFRQVFPNLGQEGPAMVAELQDYAIDPRTQLRQSIGLIAESHGLWRRQHADLDTDRTEFLQTQRREARILETRRTRVFAHVVNQIAVDPKAADATAQLAVLFERYKRGPGLLQESGVVAHRYVQAELTGDGGARNGDQ